ncbi:MAG: hypothetical protein IBX64_08110 [Actinobacteria bacterium]|nr:hypothetical protein [Actinomycetota bacterium]
MHSDAHDKRRQKKLDRTLCESQEAYEKLLSQAKAVEYFCREAAAKRLKLDGSPCHYCSCTVVKKEIYARGRPLKNGERRIAKVRYVLEGEVLEDENEVKCDKGGGGVLCSTYQCSHLWQYGSLA